MPFMPFTETELAAVALVQTHQLGLNERGKPETELLICLSGDGSYVVDAAAGAVDRVELTDKMLVAAASASGCRLIHNHPKEGSLSSADWRLASAYSGIAEMTAVNSRGSIFRGAPLRPIPHALATAVASDRDDLSVEVEQAVSKPMWDTFNQALSGGRELPSPEGMLAELRWIWSHLVNERLHGRGDVLYDFQLAPSDKVDLDRVEYARIIATGRNTLAALLP